MAVNIMTFVADSSLPAKLKSKEGPVHMSTVCRTLGEIVSGTSGTFTEENYDNLAIAYFANPIIEG